MKSSFWDLAQRTYYQVCGVCRTLINLQPCSPWDRPRSRCCSDSKWAPAGLCLAADPNVATAATAPAPAHCRPLLPSTHPSRACPSASQRPALPKLRCFGASLNDSQISGIFWREFRTSSFLCLEFQKNTNSAIDTMLWRVLIELFRTNFQQAHFEPIIRETNKK